MRTWIASAISGFLVLAPLTSFGATIDLDAWRVTASDDGASRLNLSVEYTGNEDIAPAPAVITVPIEAPVTDTVKAAIIPIDVAPSDVLINEFVSDPVTGQPEWVELTNTTDHLIALDDWYLQEGSGKITKLEGWIAPEGFLVIEGISGSLNNGGDLIQLYTPDDEWIDGVAYGEWENATAPVASDPLSVGRDRDRMFVEMNPTAGAQNIVVEAASVDVGEEPIEDVGTGRDLSTPEIDKPVALFESTSTNSTDTPSSNTYDLSQPTAAAVGAPTTCPEEPSSAGSETDAAAVAIAAPLGDIRSHALGTRLVTEGIVSVIPGVLGKQFFYLAGSGIQVYLYSAEFPLLARGDRLRVEGELRESSGESRLKVDEAAHMTLLEHGEAPQPHDVAAADIGEGTEGWLVRINGSVVEASSGEFTVADETAEVRVVVQPGTGIATSAHVGDIVTVTGIVGQTRSGYRLLPRDKADLVVRTASTSNTESNELSVLDTQGGNGAGWLLSGMTVLGLTSSAGAYVIRKKFLS